MDTYLSIRKCLTVGIILMSIGTFLIPVIAQDSRISCMPTSAGWMKTFGGKEIDYGYSAQETTDDGYILVGETGSFGSRYGDVWLIKTDVDGNKLWDKTFGGMGLDSGLSIQQTSDGGYIIAGYTDATSPSACKINYDVWLIKTDTNGNEEWNRTFGGNDIDNGYSVQQTKDNGYIITGTTSLDVYSGGSGDVWLIKTDTDGNEEWNRTFGGAGRDSGYSVQQTTDNGYIITGETGSFGAGYSDVWLIKTDTNGNEEWNRTFGGTHYDLGRSVQQTIDSGYIITGATYTPTADAWLIKTDTDGNEEWNRTFGGNDFDKGYSVQQTSDGGYIILGGTESFLNTDAHLWLIKTDNIGNEEWKRTFTRKDLHGCSIKQTSDGGYIIAGYTHAASPGTGKINLDVLLIKTDIQGKSKTISSDSLWFERLFPRFPNAFPLLRHLLQ